MVTREITTPVFWKIPVHDIDYSVDSTLSAFYSYRCYGR